MAINLYKHNEEAYNSALEMLNMKGKAAVIHQTGTGKSFIGFKLCEDFPDKTVCWLSPSDYIFKTQLENLYSVDAIEEEMQVATAYYRFHGEDNAVVNEHFKIIDEVRDFKKLFDKLEGVLSSSWDIMYTCAEEYYRENGNLNVPKRYITPDGYTLGSWINTQRLVYSGKVKGKELTAEQSEKLKSVGVVKNKSRLDIVREEQYSEVKKYYSDNGNLNIPKDFLSKSGKNLYLWLEHQKENRRKGKLSREKTEKLNELGIVWDNEPPWEIGFRHAKEYYDLYGNLFAESKYICADGYKLGNWLTNQRSLYRSSDSQRRLSDDKIKHLNSIGMVWSVSKAKRYRNYYEAENYSNVINP